MKFRFSEKLIIDSDVEPWRREGLRIAMLGGPGSGKSWNNSLITEQFLTQGGTVVIFQPRDEYFTLKEKFDILNVGGVHAKDMDFALTAPSIYAKAVAEDGISMIFYTSAAEDEEKLISWVSRFIRHVLNYQERHKRPLLLILEEAQEYAPRSASGHIAPPWVYNRMIKAFKDCFTQGRKLNIIAIASSQRPQELNFTIRQLANLTFFGKFSDQDIGYVDKECLKYIRKQGLEVDASRLVNLGLGEWLVIMGKQTQFIIVTEPRLTKHGAETPRLEYVVPRTTKAEKTIDQLTTTIMEALKKEETEKSELEKAKLKIKDLAKKVEVAEEQAHIKLSVKDMLETGAGSEELAAKLTKAEQEKIRLEDQVKNQKLTITDLEGQLKFYKKFEPFAQALEALIDDRLPPSNIPQGNAAKISLEAETTEITVHDAGPKEVSMTTDTTSGKLLFCAVQLHNEQVKVNPDSTPIFASAELQKRAMEYGWKIGNKAMGGALKAMIREGRIIQDDSGYRLPAKVKITIEEG